MFNQELQDMARKYRKYKRLEEEAKLIKNKAWDDIIEYLEGIGEYTVIVGEYKISLSQSSRTDLQLKELEAAYPDVFRTCIQQIYGNAEIFHKKENMEKLWDIALI